MGRVVAIVVGVLVVGLAVWAAMPLRTATTGTTGAEDLGPRIEACLVAQKEVSARRQARTAPPPPGEPSDAAVVSRACAPLYKQPSCKDAMMRFDEPPMEARSATVFLACARAYCPQLPEPKPAACKDPNVVPEEQWVAWSELRQAILRHDLGAEAAQRVLAPAR
ncbi:MAG: hypothetical protein JWN44_4245 [Myxococcales bacterium]|nr:hypothetical protein [Myxococcales bacterium]